MTLHGGGREERREREKGVKSGVKSEGWQGRRETAAKRRVTRAFPIEFPAVSGWWWSPGDVEPAPLHPFAHPSHENAK